jgi:hypothetical protein
VPLIDLITRTFQYISAKCSEHKRLKNDAELTGAGSQLERFPQRACKVYCDVVNAFGSMKNYRFYGDNLPDGAPCGANKYCLAGECLVSRGRFSCAKPRLRPLSTKGARRLANRTPKRLLTNVPSTKNNKRTSGKRGVPRVHVVRKAGGRATQGYKTKKRWLRKMWKKASLGKRIPIVREQTRKMWKDAMRRRTRKELIRRPLSSTERKRFNNNKRRKIKKLRGRTSNRG